MIGNKVTESLNLLQQKGLEISKSKTADNTDVFTINRENYRLKVSMNPEKSMSLDFNSMGPDKKELNYGIDTDLYNIADPKQASFAQAIESNIALFLESLAKGEVKVGSKGAKTLLLVPTVDGYVLVKKGRFFTTRKQLKSLEGLGLESLTPVQV